MPAPIPPHYDLLAVVSIQRTTLGHYIVPRPLDCILLPLLTLDVSHGWYFADQCQSFQYRTKWQQHAEFCGKQNVQFREGWWGLIRKGPISMEGTGYTGRGGLCPCLLHSMVCNQGRQNTVVWYAIDSICTSDAVV